MFLGLSNHMWDIWNQVVSDILTIAYFDQLNISGWKMNSLLWLAIYESNQLKKCKIQTFSNFGFTQRCSPLSPYCCYWWLYTDVPNSLVSKVRIESNSCFACLMSYEYSDWFCKSFQSMTCVHVKESIPNLNFNISMLKSNKYNPPNRTEHHI